MTDIPLLTSWLLATKCHLFLMFYIVYFVYNENNFEVTIC